jgi:hypothetical protein
MTSATYHTLKIVEDPVQPGELLLDLGHDLCQSLGWVVGDTLVWSELDNIFLALPNLTEDRE